MAENLIARLSAKYGVPDWVIQNMVGAESGGRHYAPGGGLLTSSAGAQGVAQLMPGTADYVRRKYGVDPRTPEGNLEGGVAYLSEQLQRFKSIPLALSAYNSGPGGAEARGQVEPFAETQAYVQKIMGGKAGGGPQGGAPGLVAAPPAPGFSPREIKQQFASNIMRSLQGDSAQRNRALVQAIIQMRQQRKQAAQQQTPQFVPAAQQVFSRENAEDAWGGSQTLASQFANIGFSHGLRAVSEKRDRMSTATGGVSDHWSGNKNAYAFDISNGSHPTPQMDATAMQIANALGVEWDGRSPLEITKNVNGYRVQVLYRTGTGGNHFDHIHVGVRRVG